MQLQCFSLWCLLERTQNFLTFCSFFVYILLASAQDSMKEPRGLNAFPAFRFHAVAGGGTGPLKGYMFFMYSPLIEKHASLSTLVYFASPPYPLRGCISVILFRFASRSFCTFSLSICPSAPRVSPMSPVELSLNTVRTDSPCLQPFVSYLAGHS